MLTITIIAAFAYLALCWITLAAVRGATEDLEEEEDMRGRDMQFLLVIEGHLPSGSIRLRSEPIPLAVALGAASRMSNSPVPPTIVVATRWNMDHWPEVPDTMGMLSVLYANEETVKRWNYGATVSNN